jgi:uncharacterized protein (TIGR03435 family)
MLRDHPTIRRLLLAAAGIAAGVGVMLAQTPARREFEVASIRPNNAGRPTTFINPFVFAPGGHFTATNVTFADLVMMAYRTNRNELQGGPAWMDVDRFDIVAKADMDQGKIEPGQWTLMIKALLEDRFKLAVHKETKETQVYAMVAGKSPPKLQPSKEGEQTKFTPGERGQMNFQKMPVVGLVNTLSNILHTTVVDQTGITGFFDFTLDPIQFLTPPSPDNPVRPDFSELVLTAVQEQLGFKFEKKKVPVEFTIVDHAEKPTEN